MAGRIASRRAARAAVACSLALACASRVELRDEGRLGRVHLVWGESTGPGLVVLFSDAQGWTPGLEAAAGRIAAAGALVVGVDLPSYLANLRASDDGCHYVVAELEDLSHRLQRERGEADYHGPILAGIGEGGTLAYAALAQAPAATLDGALSVDPTMALDTRVALCEGAPARAVDGGGHRYGAARALPGFWWVSAGRPLPPALAALTETPPDVPIGSAEDRLTRLALAALRREAPSGASLAGLPLVELPVAGSPRQLAVIYSGDGGWRDLDKQIAEVLVRKGTPVIGVDSLRYFWREKSPEVVASDLASILRHYTALWGTRRVILAGYSFGAGILPFAVNRLPEALRRDVIQVSLLGLEPRAPFEISVTGWLGAHPDGRAVLPELRQLPLDRVQCFYGEEEEDTLCTSPELAAAQRIRTAGGHHFDGDYEALAGEILRGAKGRIGSSSG